MGEDLIALVGESATNNVSSYPAEVDFSTFINRFDSLESKMDKVIELLSKDVSIDESNNEKVSITEAEGKIDEHEEYREEEERENN